MSLTPQTNDDTKSVRRLVHWWREWIYRRQTMADLDRCGSAGVERVARDLAMGKADLCILAGKWPASLNFLSRRMEELKLDATEIARVEPDVIRDLQRVCSLCASDLALAESPAERRGLRFVRLHCAQCHAIDAVGESPLAIAPPFRTLRLKYPVADLQRPLVQGIHPVMPRFQLEAGQVEDVMSYLKTLER